MKLLIAFVASLVVGSVLGYFSSYSAYKIPNHFGGVTHPEKLASRNTDDKNPKIIVIGEETFDFGSMELGSVGKHVFKVKNVGQAPLKLKKEGTTCKCTLSNLAEDEILPGATAEIELEWKPVAYAAVFSQTATISTNDPRRTILELKVIGRVSQSIHLEPAELNLNNASANQSHKQEAVLYTHLKESLKIERLELEGKHQEFYEVDHRPLTTAELEEHPGATSGYKITVLINPGLPLGSNRADLNIHIEGENKMIPLSIRSQIVGDVTVASISQYKLNSIDNILRIGTVDTKKGTKAKLNVIAKGPHRAKVNVMVKQIKPDFIKADFENVNELNNGAVRIFPLNVEIPMGSPSATHLGSKGGGFGEITLAVEGHPTIQEVFIRLYFSVVE